jgi:putative membrane protein
MWGGYGWMSGWMAPVMGLSALLWWVLAVVLLVAVLRWLRATPGGGGTGPGNTGTDPGQDARQVLDVRFARGEIDADEYGERRRLLTER